MINKAKAVTLAVLPLLFGCSTQPAILVSPMFGVCASVIMPFTYKLDEARPVDWDSGIFRKDGGAVDVYVGLHPDFPKHLIQSSLITSEKFALVGKQNQPAAKIVFAAMTNGHPLYVMFTSDSVPLGEASNIGATMAFCPRK